MPLPRSPNPEDLEVARAMVGLRDQRDDLIAKGRFLLSMGDNPGVRGDPELAANYIQASQKWREAEESFNRAANMVRVAVGRANREAMDVAIVRSMVAKWEDANGGLSGTIPVVPRSWTWEEFAVVALFVLAGTAVIVVCAALVATLGTVATLIGIIAGAASIIGGAAIGVSIEDRKKLETNIDAAAAGIEASPTISQIASQTLGTAKVLGIVGVIGLALWIFGKRRARS